MWCWKSQFRILGVALLALGSFVRAGNHTVDDADTAIIYTPSSSWSVGNTCTGCFAQPERTQAYMQTWHDTTRGNASNPDIYFEYTFTGTDVYVYGILIDIVETTFLFTTNVNLTLTIDDESYDYQHPPLNTNSYEYQIPVFSIHNLPNQSHHIRVALKPNSNFLFDYLVYTTSDASSSQTQSSSPNNPSQSSSSSNKSLAPGTIAGIAVGVVAVLGIIAMIIAFLLWRRMRQRKGNKPVALPMAVASASDPLVPPGGHLFPPNPSAHSTSDLLASSAPGEADRYTARGYEIPASFIVPAGSATGSSATNSALNSKQRMQAQQSSYLPAQMVGGRGGGGGGGGGSAIDDLSSGTGPASSSSSDARHAYSGIVNNGPVWAQPMPLDSLYPHGVAPTPAPDYSTVSGTGTGYMSSEFSSSGPDEPTTGTGSRNPHRHSVAQSSVFSEGRPPTAPPPYPRSPPPNPENMPPIPHNLATIQERYGLKR